MYTVTHKPQCVGDQEQPSEVLSHLVNIVSLVSNAALHTLL